MRQFQCLSLFQESWRNDWLRIDYNRFKVICFKNYFRFCFRTCTLDFKKCYARDQIKGKYGLYIKSSYHTKFFCSIILATPVFQLTFIEIIYYTTKASKNKQERLDLLHMYSYSVRYWGSVQRQTTHVNSIGVLSEHDCD